MNCPNCGFEAQPGETVCLACGQPLYGVKNAETTSFAVVNENQAYDVVLKKIGGNKIAVIKVVKETLGLGLADAKDTVEAMGVIATGMTQTDAEAFVTELRANGATAELCESGEFDEGLYDVTISHYADREAALQGIMKHYECDYDAAILILDEALLDVEVSKEEAEECARVMSEYGVSVDITESEELPANTNEYTPGNKPAMIGFILSVIALFMAILPMGMVQYSFWSLFAPPAIVLGSIGLKIAAKGGGKKIFAILALVFAIGAFLFLVMGTTLRV